MSCISCIYKSDDIKLRRRAAKKWTKAGFHIKSEEINCEGCHSKGILLRNCNTCKIRLCGFQRQFNNCAECKDFPCENLKGLWDELHVPQAE